MGVWGTSARNNLRIFFNDLDIAPPHFRKTSALNDFNDLGIALTQLPQPPQTSASTISDLRIDRSGDLQALYLGVFVHHLNGDHTVHQPLLYQLLDGACV